MQINIHLLFNCSALHKLIGKNRFIYLFYFFSPELSGLTYLSSWTLQMQGGSGYILYFSEKETLVLYLLTSNTVTSFI